MNWSREPIFCFTSDLDWAPESMIEETLEIFKKYNVPLTPFITHRSEAIERCYEGEKAKYVGLHPNFLPNSSHGKTVDDVISHVIGLWPGARCFRSHNYVDSLVIAQKFYEKGFRYDSNLCLYLEPHVVPLHHATGLLRFPVFFEDILFLDKNEDGVSRPYLLSPLVVSGLKIFNFHPIHVCLNTPNVEYYLKVKSQVYEHRDWASLVYHGIGIRTYLEMLLGFMQDKEKVYLDELYEKTRYPMSKGLSPYFLEVGSEPDNTHVSVWTGRGLQKEYEVSDADEKAEMLKKVMDDTDAKQIYATSPDFNLRELEIDFIINNIRSEVNQPRPGILDIGCGNGYTDLRIAQTVEAGIMVGIDFSESMIEGARHLRDRTEGLKSEVHFWKLDVRDLGRSYPPNGFDAVISERLLTNLPDRETQCKVIQDVYGVLNHGGIFIMVEGTRDGLRNLNELRTKVGLDAIPDKSETNVASLKFEEEELEEILKPYFTTLKKQYFGMYYLISRVIHPLLVSPDKPRYDAKINEVARKVATAEPDYRQLSHIVGYVLKKV